MEILKIVKIIGCVSLSSVKRCKILIKSNVQDILLRVKDIYVAFSRNKYAWTNNPTLSMDKFGTPEICTLYTLSGG